MRVYRILLHLYPTAFRNQYGGELSSIFARRLRDASNPFALAYLWLEAITDIFLTAMQSHWDILGQDVRFTLRSLRRSPGFAATAILVAALGVGATTAAYTITDHVLIRPLPFPEADRLVDLWEDMSPGNYNQMEPSPANYRDWKRMSRSFSGMAAYMERSVSMVGAGDPEQVEGAAVKSDLFAMLGAQAMLGRLPTASDDQTNAGNVVVLSYGMWQRRFGSDPHVLGKRILFDGRPYDVIGVMGRAFAYPHRTAEFWTALPLADSEFEDRNDNYLHVVAKLRPGTTLAQARSEMRIVSDRLRRQYPKDNEHVAVSINKLSDETSDRSRLMLFALLGASFCVLLIACTNLANLLLARALVRRKEVAVRTALGAGRERLIRQMLTESLILSLTGGFVGVLLAAAFVPFFSSLVPNSLPIAAVPSIDGRVLLFALLLAVVTGMCFGVLPAMRVSTSAGLKEGSRQGVGGRKERLRGALVVAQISISFVLLASAGLLIRALWQLEATDPGFAASNVLTLRTALPMPRYEPTALRDAFYKRVLSEIRRLPGVTNDAYASFLPINHQGGIWPVTMAGQPPNVDRAFHQASLRFVTPDYFTTMRIPLLRGRAVSQSDTGTSQLVAVVSQSFVREYWPNEDPIGRQFDFGFATRTVVGIAGDVRVRGVERSSEPQVYLAYNQVPDAHLTWYAPKDLIIRSSLTTEQLLPSVRRIIAEADPQQPISDVQTLTHIMEEATAPRRLQVRVLIGFALVAILLAGIGIHGLLSFTVSNRAQEIGVRIAVGAQSIDILAMVLRESAVLAAVGIAAGIALGYLGGLTLSSLLVGIHPGDLLTFTSAALLIGCMTLAGSLMPALRAVKTNPISAIRSE